MIDAAANLLEKVSNELVHEVQISEENNYGPQNVPISLGFAKSVAISNLIQ